MVPAGVRAALPVFLFLSSCAAEAPREARGAASALTGSDATPVMFGLRNPRGLAFGKNGALYVAEAGRGDDPADGLQGKCFEGINQPVCYGPTGALSRLKDNVQERVVDGLPSFAGANGAQARGPNDVAVLEDLGEPDGSLLVVVGLQADPGVRADVAEANAMARLVHIGADGTWSNVADFGAHEVASDPDDEGFDTNAYGLLAEEHDEVIVADAGANALIGFDGTALSTLAVFPKTFAAAPKDAVPTTIVRAPDRSYLVGELTGFPPDLGQSRIWKVKPDEPLSAPEVACTGFSVVIDMAFGPDGGETLYVVEHLGDGTGNLGRLLAVTRCEGGATYVGAAILTGLTRPTSVAVGADEIYVTQNGTSPTNGQVLHIPIP